MTEMQKALASAANIDSTPDPQPVVTQSQETTAATNTTALDDQLKAAMSQ